MECAVGESDVLKGQRAGFCCHSPPQKACPHARPSTPPNPTALRPHRIAIPPSRLPPQESAAVDRFVAEVTESSNGMAVAEPPEADMEEGS